ncbi:MAG: cytochrome c biogenesis protein CcdA [Actinobacteria bacterium]|nr:cytochrome c biogenesis protein CcdA [Actinomycetota bacterium]
MDITFITALTAGFVTFFSPCVLPLIPVYISLITGFSIDELRSGVDSKRIFQLSLKLFTFIAGFTFIFVALGATGAAIGQFLIKYKFYILRFAGLLMVIFGLYLLGILKIPLMDSVFRFNPKTRRNGSIFSSFVFGIIFGFAWSPCSGPILGSIIMLASTSANVTKGAFYLFAYSLGIAIPLFLSGIAFTYFFKFLGKFKKLMSAIDKVAGALILLVGLLFLTGYQHLLYL